MGDENESRGVPEAGDSARKEEKVTRKRDREVVEDVQPWKSSILGHRYISSTESYQQNEMEGLAEEVNKFHPLG